MQPDKTSVVKIASARRLPRWPRALGALLLLVVTLCGLAGEAFPAQLFVRAWGSSGTGPTQFGQACGIDVDNSFNLYVADSSNNRISVYSKTGLLIRNIPLGWSPWGLAVDGSVSPGTLFVSDMTNQVVRKLDLDGNVLATYGTIGGGTTTGNFTGPRGVAIDNGYLYVVDLGPNTGQGRLQRLTTVGGSPTLLASGLGLPLGVTVDPYYHYIYVADIWVSALGRGRTMKFNSAGGYLGEVGTFSSGQNPLGVTADMDGYVYISEYLSSTITRLAKYDSSGTLVDSWGAKGSGNGQFSSPYDLVVVGGEEIYVADTSNDRIQHFTSDSFGASGKTIEILPATNQTQCFSETGAVIDCSFSTGQSAENEWAAMPWPSPRFIDNGDGTITDRLTGLIWLQDGFTPTVSGCTGGARTWIQALDYVGCLNTNNYKGSTQWRLPSIVELRGLTNSNATNPGDYPTQSSWLNGQGFTSISGSYWSGTANKKSGFSLYAWKANLSDSHGLFTWDGNIFNTTTAGVLAVRVNDSRGYNINGHPVDPLKSGQKKCYDVNGNEAGSCYGQQDGKFQVLTSYGSGGEWPDPRFVDNGNQTVTDNLTHFIWMKNAMDSGPPNCQPPNYPASKTWQQALDFVKCLNTNNYLGFNDWRLPNSNEIASLFNYGAADNSNRAWLMADNTFLNVATDRYWTSTSHRYSTSVKDYAVYATVADNTTGVADKVALGAYSYFVWPVRGGGWVSGGITIKGGARETKGEGCGWLSLYAYHPTGISTMELTVPGAGSVTEPYTTRRYDFGCDYPAGDGWKTVNVRFQNARGEWSPTYTDKTLLDSTRPTTSITPAAGNYDSSASSTLDLTVSCADSGSGCLRIYYTTDGTDPSVSGGTRTTVHGSSATVSIPRNVKQTNVRFYALDKAGNVQSAPYNPVTYTMTGVTTPSKLTGWYSGTQNVTLSCQHAVPGYSCSSIKYAVISTAASCASATYATYVGAIALSTNAKLCYYSIDNATAIETTKSQLFSFESTSPTAALTAPANGAALDTLYQVTGTVADTGGSGVNRVEVQITDGTWYVQANQSMSTTPAWLTATLNGSSWSLNTSLVNWTSNTTYTINARAYDNTSHPELTPPLTGNVSTIATRTFKKVPAGGTMVDFHLSSQSIQQNGTVSISGKLTRLPDEPGYDLTGLPVSLVLKNPAGGVVSTTPVTTSDSSGHFSLASLSGFTSTGLYTVVASFAQTAVLGSSTQSYAVNVGNSPGYVVLIEGKTKDDPARTGTPAHNPSHARTVGRILEALKKRGIDAANTLYFGFDSSSTAYVTTPAKGVIEAAFSQTGATYTGTATPLDGKATLVSRLNANPGPLYVIFVDHGDPNRIYIDSDTSTSVIPPTTTAPYGNGLKQWLDTLEGNLGAAAQAQKRVVVLGSCYSGSFLSSLAPVGTGLPKRVLIASAAAGEQSFQGGMESDGVRSGEFFLDELFANLRDGLSFRDSFNLASAKTRAFTQSTTVTPAPPWFDYALQHPLLDDSGDGVGVTTSDSTTADGTLAKDLYLGFATSQPGPSCDPFGFDPTDPVLSTQTLTPGTSPTSLTLYVKTCNYATTIAAWVELRDPSQTLARTGLNRQLDPLSSRTTGAADLPANGATQRFEAAYSGFVTPGKYELFHYAKEAKYDPANANGGKPIMKRSVVYKKNSTATGSPAAFSLLSPTSGSSLTNTRLVFDWSDSAPNASQPAGTGLTYTLEVLNQAGTTVIYRLEELTSSMATIDATVLGTTNGSYQWRVVAVDSYGWATSSSQTWSFTTAFTNPGVPPSASGTVTDSNGVALGSATVEVLNSAKAVLFTASTATNGYFYIDLTTLNSATAVTVRASKGATYTAQESPAYTTGVTPTIAYSPKLPPAGVTTTADLTVTLAGFGGGSVGRSVAGTACSSGCTASYPTGTAVSLTPNTNANSVFAGWSGACSGTGACSVTMGSAQSVTVTYNLKPVWVQGASYYDTLQAANVGAANGSVIDLQAGAITSPTMDQAKTVTLKGGYDGSFSSVSGVTVLQGSLTITNGSVIADNIVVQ
ncbi:MAG TPA: DUF1566 domain-containing protein [Geobacteraceae bacterium]